MQASQRLPAGTATFRGCKPTVARLARPISNRRTVVVQAAKQAEPAAVPVKALDGAQTGTEQLALNIAPEATARGLVHRYLVYVQTNGRAGTASTLTRSEVRGGGKKPYKQKGTGNARRGSSTSPLFPGGGVTFGPKPKDWSIKMNKKERRLALATALQSAAEDMLVVDELTSSVSDGKTRSLVAALEKLGTSTDRKVLLIVGAADEMLMRAGRNIEKLQINLASSIKVFDVLNADKIVVDKAALKQIRELYGAEAASVEASA